MVYDAVVGTVKSLSVDRCGYDLNAVCGVMGAKKVSVRFRCPFAIGGLVLEYSSFRYDDLTCC